MNFSEMKSKSNSFNYNFKTKICRRWSKNKFCPNGDKCSFAHGPSEMNNLYKTRICQFWKKGGIGGCPNLNCTFAHGEKELRPFYNGNNKRERPLPKRCKKQLIVLSKNHDGFAERRADVVGVEEKSFDSGFSNGSKRDELKNELDQSTSSDSGNIYYGCNDGMENVSFAPEYSSTLITVQNLGTFPIPNVRDVQCINTVSSTACHNFLNLSDQSAKREHSPRTSFLLETNSKSRSNVSLSSDTNSDLSFHRIKSRSRSRAKEKCRRYFSPPRRLKRKKSRSRSRSPKTRGHGSKSSCKTLKVKQRSKSPKKISPRSNDRSVSSDSEDSMSLVTLRDEDRIELEKAHSIVDFSKNILDKELKKKPGMSTVDNPFYAAYFEACEGLQKVKTDIRKKQNLQKARIEKYVKQKGTESFARERKDIMSKFKHENEDVNNFCFKNSSSIEHPLVYLEVSTMDESPLNIDQVESYFSSFGLLKYCIQAGNDSTVIFSFEDGSLLKTALEFGHRVEGKAVRLQGMIDGGIPVGTPSITIDSGPTSSYMSDAPTCPEEFALYIEKLASSVKNW